MENPRNSSLFNQPGLSAWLTIGTLALAGIVWILGLSAKVENQQEQIAALQAEVSNRRGAMSLIENVRDNVTRLERMQDRLHEEMGKAGHTADLYKELVARMGEHLRTLDERMVQVEQAFGWRSERGSEQGLGHNETR